MRKFVRGRAVLASAAVLVLLLGGCAELRLAAYTTKEVVRRTEGPPPQGVYKIGEPYRIDGVWYTPADDPDYDEVGIASWYGEPFHGRPTANGAIYDMNALTAAHRTLPMPSRVRVTNVENGRSLMLTVNDRGPFARGRIIDVSRRTAQLLGFYGKGTAKVRVQVVRGDAEAPELLAAAAPAGAITAEPLPPVALAEAASSGSAGGGWGVFVQAGAFGNAENARRLSAELTRIAPARATRALVDGRTVYRVRLGPFATRDEAVAMLERVIAAGHRDAHLVVD